MKKFILKSLCFYFLQSLLVFNINARIPGILDRIFNHSTATSDTRIPKTLKTTLNRQNDISDGSVPGTLDINFNANSDTPGYVTTKFSDGRDLAQAVAVQKDNKIIVAGTAFNGLIDCVALARYNSDGSLDYNFGEGGKLITQVAAGNSYAYDIALQDDGKIIVVGSALSDDGNTEFCVLRYYPSGFLDTSFGNNGKVLTDFDKRFDQANKVLVQPNGKILVAGLARPAEGNSAIALARYNTNGSLDICFGDNGKVLTMLDDNTHQALGLVLQPDSKIVISGFRLAKKSESRIVLVRYNLDGSLDHSFGDKGVVESNFQPLSFGTDVVLLPDGKIVIAANIITEGFNYAVPAIVRYNSNGTIDTTFGNQGISLVDVGSRTEMYGIIRTADGNFVIGGFAIKEQPEEMPDLDILLVGFTSEGQLNTNFNPSGPQAGVSRISIGGGLTMRDFSIAQTSDQKIVVAGGIAKKENPALSDFLVARFN